jgi:hypothetical protein
MRKRKSGLKESKKRRKKRSIDNTEAWETASWEYTKLISQDIMPILSVRLAGQDRIDYLKEILEGCPEYYPASIELGYRYIQEGMDEAGKASIDGGLQSLATHFHKKC